MRLLSRGMVRHSPPPAAELLTRNMTLRSALFNGLVTLTEIAIVPVPSSTLQESRRPAGRVRRPRFGTPEKYPWQTVAHLRIPKQDSFNYALKNFWEDRLRIDPWMGLKIFQPLGSPNRLRKVVYPASSALRRNIHATTVIHIKSLDELPVR